MHRLQLAEKKRKDLGTAVPRGLAQVLRPTLFVVRERCGRTGACEVRPSRPPGGSVSLGVSVPGTIVLAAVPPSSQSGTLKSSPTMTVWPKAIVS